MLPLHLLKCAQDDAVLVELKNGETYNGKLHSIDSWMNLYLHDAVGTSADGENFHKVTEIYIRGNCIKYIRVPESTIGKVRDYEREMASSSRGRGRSRSSRGGNSVRGDRRGGDRRGSRGRGGRGERGGSRGNTRGRGRGRGNRGRGRGTRGNSH